MGVWVLPITMRYGWDLESEWVHSFVEVAVDIGLKKPNFDAVRYGKGVTNSLLWWLTLPIVLTVIL